MAEDQTGPLSRRGVLWTLGGAAGLVLLGADRASPSAPSAPAASRPGPDVNVALHPTADPRPVPTVRPALWTRTPLKAVTEGEPVRRLDELVPPPPSGTVALTIDDGPHPTWTPKVLDLLDEHGVRATFFVIGEQVEEYPRLVERVVAAGHQICNHTMSHPIPFDELSGRALKREVVEAGDRISQVTGVLSRPFRAPGGAWSPELMDLLDEHDLLPVDWDVDPRDWSRPGASRIRKALMDGDEGSILLVHDGGGDRSQTVRALRGVLPGLKDRGLEFVTL